jgi:TonB family protein
LVEPKAVPLAKPTKSVDPLSVPLSNVAPKFDAGPGSSKGWYIAILLAIAVAAGAWFAVPQVREFTEGIISSSPSAPSAQPVQPASSTPASQPAAKPAQPPANSQPAPAPAAKPSTPPPARTHGGIDGPAQVSSAQPPASNLPTSTPASERTPLNLNKDAAAASASKTAAALATSSIAPLPAVSRTAAVAPTSLPAGPVTQGAPLNQVMPEISSRARSTIHGTVRVIVKVRVSPSGTVETATPASSPSRFFSEAAVQAVKQWDFTPAKVSSQAVPSDWLVRFDFTPTDTKVLPSQTKP